jgi:hypothetical protein
VVIGGDPPRTFEEKVDYYFDMCKCYEDFYHTMPPENRPKLEAYLQELKRDIDSYSPHTAPPIEAPIVDGVVTVPSPMLIDGGDTRITYTCPIRF